MSYFAPNLIKEKHCFFGRSGGVSEGVYASLNVNWKSGDDKEHIQTNRQIIAAYFGLTYADMFTMNQGVTADVTYADKPEHFKVFADGVVTDKENIILALKTADCAPVLLADYKHKVIGAAHAGWRGAYKGVVENVVNLMLEKGAKLENIAAAIGPCMQQASFEVKNDMRLEVLAAVPEADKFFLKNSDEEHFLFDLSSFIEAKLKKLHIDNVVNCKIDTYPEENGYFSFRRNTKQGLIKQPFDYPTQYSCICL